SRSRGTARLPAGRSCAEGRSVPATAVRRAVRPDGLRQDREAARARHDRARAARLHARPHTQPRIHHPRRSTEHHARADEDVPDAHRLRRQGGGHRRRHADRSRARPEERPHRGAPRALGGARHCVQRVQRGGRRAPPAGGAHHRCLRKAGERYLRAVGGASALRCSMRAGPPARPRLPACEGSPMQAQARPTRSHCALSVRSKAGGSTASIAARTTRRTCLRSTAATSCSAIPSWSARRVARERRCARTTRTWWCMQCCTCRVTATSARGTRGAWKSARSRSSPGSGTPIRTRRRFAHKIAVPLHPHVNDPSRPTLLERLSALILREPEDRESLARLLHSAYERNLLDADALSIIEGALSVSEMQVRDIMIPRAQMDVIDLHEPVEKFTPQVISTAHSRSPAIYRNRDEVIGILLAKDLLRYYAGDEDFNVREMLRPAVFVPEAKRLNVLLREFRASRNHMASA